MVDGNGEPIPLTRRLGVDAEGITYIGASGVPKSHGPQLQKRFTLHRQVHANGKRGRAANEDLEFAFARLDMATLKAETQKDERLRGRPIEFTVYRGPLGHEPVLGKAAYSYASYSYASWNKVVHVLERRTTSEFGMIYEGRSHDGKLYRFRLPGNHKGHDYYRGASGSPIVDSEGKVVSLLISGDPLKHTLNGLPLENYIPLLDIDLH